MKWIKLLVIALSAFQLTACGGGDTDDGDDYFESAEEERFAKEGRPFAQAILKQDYDAAYAMLSSHAKDNMSKAEFKAFHLEAHQEYFVPVEAGKAQVVEMDQHILSGEVDLSGDATDRAMDLMTIERYVGEVPDNVPNYIRRASLSAVLYDMPSHDPDVRACHLTYLLVEEDGKLKVAHFFYRWNDMLD